MAKKTIKARLDDLETGRGQLPIMVFEQTWDNEDLFYLAYNPDNPSKPNTIMKKQEAVDKKDLLTRDQAIAMAGDKYRTLFIVYVKNWRGINEQNDQGAN